MQFRPVGFAPTRRFSIDRQSQPRAHMAAVIPNPASGIPMSGLARALTQAGRLTPAQAETLQKKSVTDKVQFIDSLVTSGLIDARGLAVFCAETFGYPVMDLATFNVAMLPPKAIDDKLMQGQ